MSRRSSLRGAIATRSSQRGAVAIMAAVFLIVMLSFGALALDSYHLFLVRSELQNDADAAALAGAGYLVEGGNPAPDFDLAVSKARLAIPLNPTLRAALENGTVQGGYWSSADGFQSLPMTPGSDDFPALQVAVTRALDGGDEANAPVWLFLAPVFGMDTAPVSARATAVVVPPGSSNPGGLFPLALTQCLYQNYWDYDTNKPKNDPETGEPYIFRIGSAYHYGPCESGQWTSFLLDVNDVSSLRDLVENGNPDPVTVDDQIWIEPGAKTAIYTDANNCSAAGDKSCEWASMPIMASNDVETHAEADVVAFACVHILSAEGGSDKYVEVQMGNGCSLSGGNSGPYFGSTVPPKLAQ